MSEIWEKELKQPADSNCCDGCGYEFSNGDAYYEIAGMRLCDDCINDSKRIFDIDEYTYMDYLTEKYERERCDG